MRAWEAGIVVVTGAGNSGPNPLTIGVPGNVPYVITVGAITDNYTPLDSSDDYIPSFSSAGPTFDGFVKPELVAPGAHILGLVGTSSLLAQSYPQFALADNFFSLSGTSMSAAVTSGIVALMLDAEPSLTPDEVKCRLIDTAHTALDDQGNLGFSVFQQGAGVVNAFDAVNSTASGCANGGLDVSADLADTSHFIGTAELTPEGLFIVRDENGNENFAWDGQFSGTGGTYFWSGGTYFWSGGTYFWSGAEPLWSGSHLLWTGGTYFWSGGTYFWSGGTYFWSGSQLDPIISSLATPFIMD
jgi:serine protease AprX